LRNQIKGFLIGVEPYKISFNFGLSRVIENKRNKIEEKVKEVIKQLIN